MRRLTTILMISLWLPLFGGVHTLDNGLTVIVKQLPGSPVVSIWYGIKTGSGYEEGLYGTGISHYVEHLVGDGTEHYTKAQIDSIKEALGGMANAYTTKELTCYYITVSEKHLRTALDLLTEEVFRSTIPQEAVDMQRGIILKEILQNLDEPEDRLYQLMMRALFLDMPMRYPTIGYTELFKGITRDELIAYYRKHYVPNNAILAIAGDVDEGEVLNIVDEIVGTIKPGRYVYKPIPAEPAPPTIRMVEDTMAIEKAYLAIGFRNVDIAHPDLYPIDVLATLLGEGESSILRQRLTKERNLALTVDVWSHTPHAPYGYFAIWTSCVPESLEQLKAEIFHIIDELKEKGVPSDAVDRAKRIIRIQYLFRYEKAEEVAESAIWDYFMTGDADFTQKYLDRIDKVTVADVNRVLRTYLDTSRMVIAQVVPPEYVSKPAVGEQFYAYPPKKTVLDNGIRVVTREVASPLTGIVVGFLGGVRYEPEGKHGVCNLMMKLLFERTKRYTREELAEMIDELGGQITPFSGNNSFGIEAQVLAEDTKRALELIAEILQDPLFDEEDFKRLKARQIQAIKAEADNPYLEVMRIFRDTLYKSHPYHSLPTGELTDVEELTLDDVKTFYSSWVRAPNMVIAVYGGIDSDEVVAWIDKLFDRLPDETITYEVEPPQFDEVAKTVELRTSKLQSIIFWGWPGMRVDDVDRYPMHVLDAIISGIYMPGGWLHSRLRGAGLVYVVHAYNWLGLDDGFFLIYAATAPDKVDSVLTIMEGVIREITTTQVDSGTLEKAKQICVSRYAMDREKLIDQARIAVLDELYGLGYDWSDKDTARIKEVTAEDVLRVARKYLRWDNYLRVVTNRK